jgi:predicted dehydrogenase
MSPDQPLRIGIIGAGNIGKAYAMAIASRPSVVVGAVCDIDDSESRALASTTGVPGFDSHKSLAESETCDAVIVSTPPATHAPVVIDCLDRGLDVLCEKPFTLDLETAQGMFDVATRNERLLAMASKFRYVSDVAQARDLIRSGLIGDPMVIDVMFASRVDMSDRWNTVEAISGGGVLIDNGTHAVDIVRYLVGPIRRVSAMRGPSESSEGVEDTAIMLAETSRDTIASIQVSWAIAPNNESFVVVHGTKGTIEVGWSRSMHRGADGGDWVSFGHGYSKMDALGSNVENFAAASRGREPIRISTVEVLASVAVIEGAYRGINSGRWVDIEPQEPPSSTTVVASDSRAG